MSAIDKIRVVQLTSPVDTTSTTVNSDVIGTKELIGIKFVVSFGTITGDTVVVTVEECDDTTPSNSTAIAYLYSKDGAAIGTDTAGAWTAVASTGVTIADTDDDKNLIIKVDPAALTADYPYLRVVADPGGSASAVEIAINAIVEERYNQSTNLSLVD
jgi:phage baseplate assembly protein gpV